MIVFCGVPHEAEVGGIDFSGRGAPCEMQGGKKSLMVIEDEAAEDSLS